MHGTVPYSRQERHWLILTALLSLLLASLALATDPVLNRDGMYYVDAARTLLSGGAPNAQEWLLFPAMLAAVASVLQVDPVSVALAYSLLTSVLLAVVLYLWLQTLGRGSPPWLAALTAVTAPWALAYQTYVIRDSAAWVAVAACLWLASLWVRQQRWRWLALMAPTIAVGFAFRTEMLVLLAVPAWLLLRHAKDRGPWVLASTLALGLLAVSALLWLVHEPVTTHIQYYLKEIAKRPDFMLFPEFVAMLESQVNVLVRDDLSVVLVLGMIMLPVQVVASHLDLHLLALLALPGRRRLAPKIRDGGASMVLALVFLAVVAVFIFLMQFVAGRYLVPVALCLTPWVYQGVQVLHHWRPRLLHVLAVLLLLAAVQDSVSLGPGKGYMRDAGNYVADHRAQLGTVYYTDARVAFYAGEPYRPGRQRPLSTAAQQRVAGSHSLVWLYRGDSAFVDEQLAQIDEQYGFSTVVYRQDNGDDRGVVILSR